MERDTVVARCEQLPEALSGKAADASLTHLHSLPTTSTDAMMVVVLS